MTALVTIGVPVYNGARYAEETLRSLLAQDYGALEIVVADNASTDGTLDLCRDVVAGDDRVRFLTSERNRGAAWNYNRLLNEVRGPFFKWAAADDLCEPTFVSRCVDALDAEGPGTVIAYPQSVLIDEESRFVRPVDDADLALSSPAPHQRVARLLRNRFEWHPVFGVMRTESVLRTCRMGAYVLADAVFLVEMALRGRFHQVPDALFLRRYHAERPLIAQPRFKDQAAWFDTSGGRGGSFPQVNVAAELARAIRRSRLPAAEQARCLVAAGRSWVLPHWRHIGGEVKMRALDVARPR